MSPAKDKKGTRDSSSKSRLRTPRNRWADWESRVRPLYLKTGNASEVARELGLNEGSVNRWVKRYGLDEERRRYMASSATAAEGTLQLLANNVEKLLEKVNNGQSVEPGDIDSISKLSSVVRQLNKDAQVVPNAMKAFNELLEVIGRDDPELRILIAEKYLEDTLKILDQKFGTG